MTTLSAVGLLEGAMAAEHSVCPLVHMVHLLVVAFSTGECSPATWEAEPTVALLEMTARSLVWQWHADLHAQLSLMTSGVLQLSPRRLSVALLVSDLAPMRDPGAEDVCPFDGEVLLRMARCATGALAVARAHVANPNLFCALPTGSHNVTAQKLHHMAIRAKYVRHGRATTMANAWSHGHQELLLASCTRGLRRSCIGATTFHLDVRRLLTSATNDLHSQDAW